MRAQANAMVHNPPFHKSPFSFSLCVFGTKQRLNPIGVLVIHRGALPFLAALSPVQTRAPNRLMRRSAAAAALLFLGSAHSSWLPATRSLSRPRHRVVVASSPGSSSDIQLSAARDPFSLLAAAQFLAEEMGDEVPLKTGPARTALFFASLTSPGSLPNPFTATRWEPMVYTARDSEGAIMGIIQTALANIEPGGQQLRTVRFFQNVVVAERCRRRGVATALLEFADAADSRYGAALAVEPQNEGAVQLYQRFGFEMVDGEPEREGMRLMTRR